MLPTEISLENTQSLLKDASQAVYSRRREADAILEQLRRLNPVLADQVQPKEDAIKSLKLRMLCASGSVSSFLVISYCWHSPAWRLAAAAQPICPGWEISQPMVDKVISLRESNSEGVWLDKLCIDQENDEEKQVAISSMDIIYQSARRLIILLEDVQLDEYETLAGVLYSELFQRVLDELEDSNLTGKAWSESMSSLFQSGMQEVEDKVMAKLYKEDTNGRNGISAGGTFFMKLLSSRWFTRAWCAHESMVVSHRRTNNPLFLCFGNDNSVLSFEFVFMHFLPQALSTEWSRTEFVKHKEYTKNTTSLSLEQCRHVLGRLHSQRGTNATIMELAANVSNLECRDEKDLASITLNIAGLPLSFGGALHDREDLIWVFSVLALASGDITPLFLRGTRLQWKSDGWKNKFSWCDMPFNAGVGNYVPIPSPALISSAERDSIELDIYLFRQTPFKPSPESLHKAQLIIQRTNLKHRVHPSLAKLEGLNLIDPATKEKIRKAHLWFMLASAIDCGFEWIRRFPYALAESITFATGTRSWRMGEFDDHDLNLISAAKGLLMASGKSKADGTTFTFDEDEVEQAVRFLTCILDTRMDHFSASAPNPMKFGENEFAITDQIETDSWLAIPTAMAHLPLAFAKVWVIEPIRTSAEFNDIKDQIRDSTKFAKPLVGKASVHSSDSTKVSEKREIPVGGNWQLRKRQFIMNCAPIIPDQKSVVLLQKQRVYGPRKE